MKVVYVYTGHKLFMAWGKGVANETCPFVDPRLFNLSRMNYPKSSLIYILNEFVRKRSYMVQLLAGLTSFSIPKADVYVIESINNILPVLMRKPKHAKIILINGDPTFYQLPEMTGITKSVLLKYLKHVDGIISLSDHVCKLSKKFTDVPNRVNLPWFDVEKFTKMRADLSSNDICYVGGTLEIKRTDLVAQVFEKMNKLHGSKLYIVGSLVDRSPTLDRNLDNKDVKITGWIDDPENYLKKCGFYLNPARIEAFGLNVIEAMAVGIPPLVTDECGAAQVVRKISPKLIIKPTVEDIVDRMEWLNSDMEMKKKLGEQCRKEAMKYTKEWSVNNFRKHFNEILEEIKVNPH